MKTYDPNCKSIKTLVHTDNDCTLLVFKDPNGEKASKEMNMKSEIIKKEVCAGNKEKD